MKARNFTLLLGWLVVLGAALTPTTDIRLFPNTQNSPSLYLIQFTLAKALPSDSYILIEMDWYTSPLTPYNCILVNSSIGLSCTSLALPTFPLSITTAQIAKFNPKLTAARTVAVVVSSMLLANTVYCLQLHLYNVIPNIQHMSPSIEMYTVSYNGLIYETNTNFGAVINNPPQTNLMTVSVLNDLSAKSPGASVTLRAEVTIGQAITTSLSTFIFVMQYPFTFSVGSIPATVEATTYATNPISLYSKPTISSYEVVSPNIFRLIFSEQFVVGRKFIVEIDQISCPFFIATTNISIYSLNYNSLTPLEAYEGLYPIQTVSYPLTLTLGLPYSAPFMWAMQFYQSTNEYAQLQVQIPYSVPDGYSLMIKFTSADLVQGSAYCNFQSLNYLPKYTYTTSTLRVDNFGPVVVGTIITFTFKMTINTNSLFKVEAYIDTSAVITATASTYMYYGLVESSGVLTSDFLNNINDNQFSFTERVRASSSIVSGQYLQLTIWQNVGTTATSSGAYLEVYMSPYVSVSPTFSQTNDCRINGATSTCLFTYFQTSTYLKLVIKGSNPSTNIFPYRTYVNVQIYNLLFPLTSSNKNLYPVYIALYKADVVSPTAYYTYRSLHLMPLNGQLGGASIAYINNFFTSTAANYQTYPGVVRFQSAASNPNLAVTLQPNEEFVIVFFAYQGFRSFPLVGNMDSYPCTSNIGVKCTYFLGEMGVNQIFNWDRVVVRFSDLSYSTTNFHILIPDTQIFQNTKYFYYHTGTYNLLTKDIAYVHADSYTKTSGNWVTTPFGSTQLLMAGDMVGKAGSYRKNVSVTVYGSSMSTGANSYVFLCTQWSFFQNGVTSYSAATSAMTTPATFGSLTLSPLAVYLAGGMYLTVIPFRYVVTTSPFTFWLDNAHMPYTYDLPSYYIYTVARSTQKMDVSNSFIMMNGGTFYSTPLQSLLISCHDNAVGVVSTYCTFVFGTTNPLLANGNIRLVLSGMTVATSTCYLSAGNGTNIPVTCASSTDNKNVTVTMTGWEFYAAGNFTLVVYGVGISSSSLSQSVVCYLYDSSLMYVIEWGLRLLTTTIASLSYITLSEILYTYLNPLSSNTMTISFYLPRPLYQDEQFAFVIGQDLSDVNTEVARLNIQITRSDGLVLYPLYSIDNINYLIIFSFVDATQLTMGNYSMTIYGVLTPASQSNGAFNMIYRRLYDFTYTIVNSANVIFPSFGSLVTSNISLTSYFNSEGYKQELTFTIVNSDLNVDSSMVWIINFPSYYSPQLFAQDAYCLIDSATIPCTTDPNTPYQLVVTSSPKTVSAGTAYSITVVGLACPRATYTNNVYPNRYIFVGVLQNSSSAAYAERSLLLPYQGVQASVGGIVNVVDMVGVSAGSLFAFSSIYAQFRLLSSVDITSGSYLYIDLPIQFDNLNNIAISAIVVYGAAVNSCTAAVRNRRIQIPIAVTITQKTTFDVQFPNLPTPKSPCSVQMSEIIVTVTGSSRLSIYAASAASGNSAPRLTFVKNSRYISFNYDRTITITAGTYSAPIPITTNDNSSFLSNVNVKMQSTGFLFDPSTLFLPIGQSQRYFRIGADSALVPVVYFYQALKQEEVNTNYQITLNMNIQVTNDKLPISLPATLSLPRGGCTNPFTMLLPNPPFLDLTISYVFDNSVISESEFFPNPLTTPSQMLFSSSRDNNSFSFCSSSSLSASQVALTFHLSGTNYNSYYFSPSNQVTVNVVAPPPNTPPVLALRLINQQKTFLDVNFTNSVDALVFYHLQLGQNQLPLSLQAVQVSLKAGVWVLAAQSDLLTRLYASDRDSRLGMFFQTASTSTVRLGGLLPETFYTLCAYAVNVFSVASAANCLQVSTMTWGSVLKASLRFTHQLSPQELNNVLCFFTAAAASTNLYVVDIQGNSCGNRSVTNLYYNYTASSSSLERWGTNLYLVTNPTLTGTDPSPLAFSSLFSASGALTAAALLSAQSMFSITYLSGSFSNTFNARLMTSSSQTALTIFFSTPTFAGGVLTVANIQMVGGVGTVYFALVLYKQIVVNGTSTSVSIRMNQAPKAEQVLNCESWLGVAAEGCARAVYSGVGAVSVSFLAVQSNSLYLLYYVAVSQFPLRPVIASAVQVETIVTYSWQSILTLSFIILVLLLT